MKKVIVILCLLVVLPVAVSAQSKTVFQDVPGMFCLTDEQGNKKQDTVKKYDKCSFRFHIATVTPFRYLSLTFKLLGPNDETVIRLGNQSSFMEKIDNNGKIIYEIHDFRDYGNKQMFSFTSSTNNPDKLEIIWYKYKKKKQYPYGIYSFKTETAPVFEILEWIYNNNLISH